MGPFKKVKNYNKQNNVHFVSKYTSLNFIIKQIKAQIIVVYTLKFKGILIVFSVYLVLLSIFYTNIWHDSCYL